MRPPPRVAAEPGGKRPDMTAEGVCKRRPASLDVGIDDQLRLWRQAGRKLVVEQWDELQALIAEAERLIVTGRQEEAIVATQIAVHHAVIWHCGVYASPALERLIRQLGLAALATNGASTRSPDRPLDRLRVLHVASEIRAIGGHARMLWRWIGRDHGNVHSVALTRQTMRTPEALAHAVAATGGAVSWINRRPGGAVAWARALQRVMEGADLVFLHVNNYDILPFLALAGMRNPPPVALLNHCDHLFWLGADFVDAVVNTRRSGHALCADRRGIAPERNLLLPLCLEGVQRQGGRAEARRALGLPEDAAMILTVARAPKFRALGKSSFADSLTPLLQANPRARLVAVGPGGTEDWRAAFKAAPGQIVMLPERPDVGRFLESADIYLDSFPFPSNTSMLEAGLHGLPLVTFSPFGPDCGVMGADSLGMDETLVRAGSLADLQARLQSLLDDPEQRHVLGAKTSRAIEATNTGAGWSYALSKLYAQIFNLSRKSEPTCLKEEPSFADLDLFTPFVFGPTDRPLSPELRRAYVTELSLRAMPPFQRAMVLSTLVRKRRIALRPPLNAWRYMLPEWLLARLRT